MLEAAKIQEPIKEPDNEAEIVKDLRRMDIEMIKFYGPRDWHNRKIDFYKKITEQVPGRPMQEKVYLFNFLISSTVDRGFCDNFDFTGELSVEDFIRQEYKLMLAEQERKRKEGQQ